LSKEAGDQDSELSEGSADAVELQMHGLLGVELPLEEK
jgi:hypothetical protein